MSFSISEDPQALNGFLLVNKPSGPTSYDVIRWTKKAHGRLKIGHCGTLDPLASGLLILLFGKATKQQPRFMNHEKIYRCAMRLGIQTDSGDITGRIVEERAPLALSESEVRSACLSFIGEQQQVPPMFSALKHQGTPLYKLARQGKSVHREPRTVSIYSMELLRFSDDQEMDLRVRCSAGTYIRTLVEDIGQKLKTVATMTTLVREAIGSYTLNQAVEAEAIPNLSFDQLKKIVKTADDTL